MGVDYAEGLVGGNAADITLVGGLVIYRNGGEDMVDPGSVLGGVKAVDESIGLLKRALGKLWKQPDVAAMKLTIALDEILVSYRAVDQAITSFGDLALTPDALRTNPHGVLAIAGGQLSVHVQQGKGSCQKIHRIYDEYLDKWFVRVFNKNSQEYKDTRRLFDLLDQGDGELFESLRRVVDSLHPFAKGIADLLDQDRYDDARDQMKEAYRELAKLQTKLVAGMSKLYELKNEFLAIARQV